MASGATAPLAREVVHLAAQRGASIAVAESLTGGALASALVDVPGASAVLRLGVVAYHSGMKASVLGVEPALLKAQGAVDPEVARQMARGVRELAGLGGSPCSLAISTTGVAGPDPQDGHPVGEVWIGSALLLPPDSAQPSEAQLGAERWKLHGDRATIRAEAVQLALLRAQRELERFPQ